MDKLKINEDELYSVNLLEEGDTVEYYTVPQTELNFLTTGFYNLLHENAFNEEPDEFVAGLREILSEYMPQAKYLIAQAIIHAVSNFDRIVKDKHTAEFKEGRLIEEIK